MLSRSLRMCVPGGPTTRIASSDRSEREITPLFAAAFSRGPTRLRASSVKEYHHLLPPYSARTSRGGEAGLGSHKYTMVWMPALGGVPGGLGRRRWWEVLLI